MERRFVYPVREAPDGALAHLRERLEREGFDVRPGQTYDLNARRGGDRVLVGLAPHPRGLVARVKCKALLPGRGEQLADQIDQALSERLGVGRQEGRRA